jgi:hypothetical protein
MKVYTLFRVFEDEPVAFHGVFESEDAARECMRMAVPELEKGQFQFHLFESQLGEAVNHGFQQCLIWQEAQKRILQT